MQYPPETINQQSHQLWMHSQRGETANCLVYKSWLQKKKKKKILHWLHKASRFSPLVALRLRRICDENVNFKSRDNVSQSNVWQSFLSLPSVSDSSCTIWMSAKDQNSHQSVIYSTNSDCLLGLGLYVSVLWEPRRKNNWLCPQATYNLLTLSLKGFPRQVTSSLIFQFPEDS